MKRLLIIGLIVLVGCAQASSKVEKNKVTEKFTCDTLTIVDTQTKQLLAEGNITLINKDGAEVTGDILEWFPQKHLIIIDSKYPNQVKIRWRGDLLLTDDKVFIYTDKKGSEITDSWEKVRVGSKGNDFIAKFLSER